MIALEPTPEQVQLQDTARAFAAEHIAPLAAHAHRHGPPADPWAAVKPIFEAATELGFTRLFVPPEHGGPGMTCLDAVIALEEIGAADVGIASDYFAATMTMPLMLLRGGAPGQAGAFLERFTARPILLAGAQSEPDVPGSELMLAGPDPAYGPKLSARRDDATGDWLLTGSKSAFITNAGAADEFFIIARSDPAQPVFTGLTIFHLPAGTPGLTVLPRTQLIGWPFSTHAGLAFDDVRLPASAVVGEIGQAAMTFARVPEIPVCLAACFVGLARAALDVAVAYAKERRSLGSPIIEHQAVALRLARMASDLHAARLTVWDAARACETDPMRAAMFGAPAAKSRAVDAAIDNARGAMETLGAYGVTREYQPGRMLADALVGWSCDFTRDVLHLGLARTL